jgi:predicted RNase H-like HicB family nuclease
VPALGNLSTYGETREDALAHTREAIVGYLEAAAKEGLAVPTETEGAELIELEVATP